MASSPAPPTAVPTQQPPQPQASQPQPLPPNYTVYAQPNQPHAPHASYVIQNQPHWDTTTNGKSNTRLIPGVKVFGVITVAIAFLLCILGIVAIVIEAQDAYVGNAIWTGVLFVLPTGLLGLASYWKNSSTCTKVSYLVLSIFTCVVCAQLVIYSSINAVREFSQYCEPDPGYYDYWQYNRWEEEPCPFPQSGRICVDAMIACLAFCQFVLCIVTQAMTCYGICSCCHNCCKGTPPPAVVQYNVQNGACQLVSIGGSRAAYQPVSVVVPVGEGGTMVPQATTVMASHPQMQSQPVLVSSPPQVSTIPKKQPGMPSVTATAPPADAQQPSSTSANPAEQKDDGLHEDELGYGQTASEHFHDEQNLI